MMDKRFALLIGGVIVAAALTVWLISWASDGTPGPAWLLVGLALAVLLRFWPGSRQ